jgi:hypothetical protein
MPIGGPIHKAAVEALDRLVDAGLLKGYCSGDMLGTAFFRESKQYHVAKVPGGGSSPKKEARNAFWITVLSLVPWQPQVNGPMPQHDDEAAAEYMEEFRAQRPVHLLRLSRAESNPAGVPVVNGDVGSMKARYIVAVLSSELITLIIGVVTAAVWKSIFSIRYLAPVLLKMTALFCHVRGKQMTSPSDKPEDNEPILCEIEDFSRGFFLIEGKSELVLQFFGHYAHPIRYRRGLLGDRFRVIPGDYC